MFWYDVPMTSLACSMTHCTLCYNITSPLQTIGGALYRSFYTDYSAKLHCLQRCLPRTKTTARNWCQPWRRHVQCSQILTKLTWTKSWHESRTNTSCKKQNLSPSLLARSVWLLWVLTLDRTKQQNKPWRSVKRRKSEEQTRIQISCDDTKWNSTLTQMLGNEQTITFSFSIKRDLYFWIVPACVLFLKLYFSWASHFSVLSGSAWSRFS